MMKSFQLRRLQFIQWFDSIPILIVRYLFLALGLASLLILLLSSVIEISAVITALSILFLSPFILTLTFSWYVHYIKANPGYRIDVNLRREHQLNNFDFVSLGAVLQLQNTKKWPAFWNEIAKTSLAEELMLRLGLTIDYLKDLMKSEPVDASSTISDAINAAEGEMVTVFSLLRIVVDSPCIQDHVTEEQISTVDLEALFTYYRGRYDWQNITNSNTRTGGFARNWAISYSNTLDLVAPLIPENIIDRAAHIPVFTRSQIIDRMVVGLTSGSKHNIVLTGEQGIGKAELFYHLVARIYTSKTSTALDQMDVRTLDISRLLSMASSPNELQQLLVTAFGEINRAGNVVLFIDRLDLLLVPDAGVGTVDISAVLQTSLDSSQVRIVATTTSQQYLELVKSSTSLSNAFTEVEVTPPNQNELFGIIFGRVPQFEHHYQVFYLARSIREIIELANRYIKDQSSPQREIELAETVASTVHARGSSVVSTEEVVSVVEQKAKVPITVKKGESQTLLNLENNLHRRVIGQRIAIKQVSDALLRARAGVREGTRPIGSFLFLGPTGVGKTETAKALAEIYFGSPSKLIRLDMTEYADGTGLQKLLGTDAKRDPGALALAVRSLPSAVVLFDEMEKADQLVKNALLPLLDEGQLTTNYGQKLDFTNTIVIATSNAGSDYIRSQVQAGLVVTDFERRLIDQLIRTNIFLTEFLNRFDGVIVFTPLDQTEIQAVVSLQLNALRNRLFKDKGITIDLSPELIAKLAIHGYDPVFGARALQRVISTELETVIARKILSENPKPGSKILIDQLN